MQALGMVETKGLTGAIEAADAGDDDAQFLLDEVEACDLLWFDVTEIADVVTGPPL